MDISLLCGLHVDQFPDVPIRVLEAMAIHEAMVLGFVVGRTASSNGSAYHGVHRCPTVARQADQHFRMSHGIAYRLGREALEAIAYQQHDEDVVADDHASCRVVGELLVEAEAELGEESDRTPEVGNGQIDEYLGGHGILLNRDAQPGDGRMQSAEDGHG